MKVIKWFKILRGKFRLFWGFCPNCNSDAPKTYDCKVCNVTGAQKKNWWTSFIKLLDNEN